MVCGSTGEAASLGPEEQASLIRLAVAAAGGRVPVIAGCGGPSTEAAAMIAGLAASCGAAGLLCASTPYVKPSQEGIIAHMRVLAHVSDLPLIVYDVPGRVGVAIKDETVATLRERGLAIGIKDATADLGRPPRLRALCGPDFMQFSGDDATARRLSGRGRTWLYLGHRQYRAVAMRVAAPCLGPRRPCDVSLTPGTCWRRCTMRCSPRAIRCRSRPRWRC